MYNKACFITCSICGPVHEHLVLITKVSSEGFGEAAHMRRLAKAFAASMHKLKTRTKNVDF